MELHYSATTDNRKTHVHFLPRTVARALGLALLGGGALLAGWFFRTMLDADAPVRTDKPVPKLTTEGPFRYTRNPGYLSMMIIYAGIAVLRNSLWAILFLPLVLFVIQREVIWREERYLEHTFGEEYWITRRGCGAGYRHVKAEPRLSLRTLGGARRLERVDTARVA